MPEPAPEEVAPTSEPASAPASAPVEVVTPNQKLDPLSFQLEQPKESLFHLSSGPVDLNFFAQIQVQVAAFVGNDAFLESDSPAIDEGYRVRRARAGLWGDAFDEFSYVLTLDMRDEALPSSAGQDALPVGAELLDAAITWRRYSFAQLTVGANKLPFSRGAMIPSFTSTFAESPFTVSRLAPSRRAGISVSGELSEGVFRYVVGQYNTSDSLSFGSLGGGLLTVARVEVAPLGAVDPNLSASRSFEGARVSIGANGYMTARSEAQDIQAAGLDILLEAGPITVLAEGLFSRVVPLSDPVLAGGAVDITNRFGAYGQVAYMIVPDRFEVAGRAEYFDDNLVLKDEGDIVAATAGFNWISYAQRIRASVNYTTRVELAGVNLRNDLLLIDWALRF
jgi:hypothetical protein